MVAGRRSVAEILVGKGEEKDGRRRKDERKIEWRSREVRETNLRFSSTKLMVEYSLCQFFIGFLGNGKI